MPRRLVILPEHHLRNRTVEAARLAKAQNGKLFVEGARTDDVEKWATELGHPVIPIEHDKLHLAMAPFIAAEGTARLNAFLWSGAKRSSRAARRFIEEEREVAAHVSGKAKSKVRLADILERLYVDAVYCANTTLDMPPFGKTFLECVGEVKECGAKGIPPKLAGTLRLLYGTLPPARLQEIETAVLTEANGFFLQKHGFGLTLAHDVERGYIGMNLGPAPKTNYDILGCLYFIVRRSDPIALYRLVSSALRRLKELRELYMAYAVVKEDFGFGVLNVGLAHTTRDSRVPEIFRECGIECEIRKMESRRPRF